MRILDKIDNPSDLKLIRRELLTKLVEEIREEIINTVTKTGGHLASSLGATELIVALHYVFNAPEDKIIFDVGHQAYAHKLLTGRRDKFKTLRQLNGISGFPTRDESEYDVFGTGHSSTALSAALGFAVARDLRKEKNKIIAVIGDGSITGGLAFEGLNNIGHLGTDIIVILNDNEMFISYRVGAIASYLTRILTLGLVKSVEKKIEKFLHRLHYIGLYLLRIAKRFKLLFFPGMLFEEMGFAYLGPINGHDLYNMIDILNNIKRMNGPVLLHVITQKGKGYKPAEKDPIKFHGLSSFEIEKNNLENDKKKVKTYSDVFSDTLIEIAEKDDKIIAITAAMSEGTGLVNFAKRFPERFFDVGIAEEHALTFSAALAADGFKPVCVIYSTFLQRGFDQLIHDIGLQNLHVVLGVDRAGIVGHDGATHQGIFDVSFLRLIPNFIVMAPKDENELRNMLFTALQLRNPVAIRYPREKVVGLELNKDLEFIEIGKSELIIEGEDVYILGLGNMVQICKESLDIISKNGIKCGLVNIRFVKPIDNELLKNLKKKIKYIVTVEENVVTGGFGSAIRELIDNNVKILSIGLPDKFIEHGSQTELRKKYGLTPDLIAERIINWIKNGV